MKFKIGDIVKINKKCWCFQKTKYGKLTDHTGEIGVIIQIHSSWIDINLGQTTTNFTQYALMCPNCHHKLSLVLRLHKPTTKTSGGQLAMIMFRSPDIIKKALEIKKRLEKKERTK